MLLAGGQLAYVDVLDPTTGALSPAPALDSPMWYPAYALDGNGQAVLLGGTDATGVTLTAVRRYGEAAAWIEGAPLLQSRTRAQAVALDDGTILVAGGAQRAVAGAPSELIPLDRLAERVATPSCGPAACAPGACGDTLDPCGAVVACGTCAPGLTCTAAHTCACVPTTCAAQGAACGTLADGCGGTLECGTCSGGLTCSAGACVDAAPPTVRIVSPEDGAIVGGNVTIQVSASDDVGVTRTALYVGSVKIGEQVGPGPYTFTWSTAYYGYGTWPLVAESRDAAGHVSHSAAVNATLLNPYATYDATLKAPRCPVTADCRSGDLVTGRSTLGPEKNTPNTVGGTCFDGTAGTFHCTYSGCESLDSVRIHSVDGGPLAPGKAVEVEAEVWAISSYDVLTVYSAPNAGQPVWTQVARVSPTFSGSATVRATFTLPTGSLQAIRGQFGLGAQSSTCSASPYSDQDDLVFGVQTGPDRTPPVAALGAPAGGATLTGPVTVTASATDDVGVTRVELYLDGVTLLKTWFGAPYSTSWDPRTVPVGSHQLTVRAFDAAGNVGQFTPVAVNVVRDQIAPTVSFVSPASGATLQAPRCASVGASCDSTTLLLGRGTLGPEPNRPNTLSGSACADGGSGSFHADESLDRLRISTVDGAPFAAGKTVRIDATVWVWGVSDDLLDLYSATDARSPSWTFLGTLAPTGTGSQTLSKTFVLGAGSLQAIRGVFRYRGSASPCGSGGYDDRDDLVFAVQ